MHCTKFVASLLSLLSIAVPPLVCADVRTDFPRETQQFEQEPNLQNLEELLWMILDDYPADALSIYDGASELVESAPLAEQLIILEAVCWAQKHIGSTETATKFCESYAEDARTVGDDRHEAAAYNALATISEREGRFSDALKLYDKAITVSAIPGMRAAIYTNIGYLLLERGAYEMAFDRFSLALEETQKSDLPPGGICYLAGAAYAQIGFINHRIGELDGAMRYYQRALDCGELAEDTWDHVNALRYLTELHLDRGDIDLADQRSKEAVEIAGQRYSPVRSIAASSRAAVLLAQENMDAALISAQSAYDNANEQVLSPSRVLATVVLTRALSANGQHSKALELLNSREQIARSISGNHAVEQYLAIKPEILSASGDLDAALAASQAYFEVSRSNLKESALERVNLLQSLLDADRHESETAKAQLLQEAADARADNAAVVRNVSIGGGLLLLFVGYLTTDRLYRKREAEAAKRTKAELEKELSKRGTALLDEAKVRVDLETRLLQTQKLETIGQLTGGVAHDFNNLMTIVIGATEMTLKHSESDLDSSDRELLRSACDAANSGAEITRQLLAFARKQPLSPVPTELSAHINKACEMFSRTLGKNISIVTSIGDQPQWCEVDRAQLSTALLNLMLNARDAMDEHGEIRLSCQQDRVGEQHPHVPPGEYYRISVDDSGCGMASHTQERAVEPFFTTKESGSGNGLGLSMVYGFAKQSRGGFSLNSELNEGTSATIWLPICRAPAPESDSAPATSIESKIDSNITVLIVEDQAIVREIAVNILKYHHYSVDIATSADQAKEMIVQGYRPTVVFCDVSMPGDWDGLHLARWLRSYAPEIPVLLTSGHPLDEPLDESIGFIGKPYGPDELDATIKQMIVNDYRNDGPHQPAPAH